MRITIAMFISLAACVHSGSPAPNYADKFVEAVFPNAPRGGDIVFVVIDKQLAACVAENKTTTCHAVANWAPQPQAAQPPVRTPQPVSPSTTEQAPAQPAAPIPVAAPAKPTSTLHPSAAGPK